MDPSYLLQVADTSVTQYFGGASSYFGVFNVTAIGMNLTGAVNWAYICAYFGGTLLVGR